MPKVLFVCTANICRSPYAQAALQAALGPGSEFVVASAGVRAEWLQTTGADACDEMPYGRDLGDGVLVTHVADHSSTQLDADKIHAADIVIAFEGKHRAAILDLVPRAQMKTYTARQVQRLARAVASSVWPDSAPERTGDVLRDLNAARSWAPYADDDDVEDPHGGGVEAHEACADEIQEIVADLAAVFVSRDR